jgi:hypothetical protein
LATLDGKEHLQGDSKQDIKIHAEVKKDGYLPLLSLLFIKKQKKQKGQFLITWINRI